MKKIAIALLLFFTFLFLSFNKHSRDDYSSYHSVLWADASGYYVYGPMWFIYGNDCKQMPLNLTEKTGNGFSFNQQTGRVITKYTCGVALLQTPFFLTAHLLSAQLGFSSDGFSPIYHGAVMTAGVFYGLLGLFFSFLFLKKYFSQKVALLTVSAFFLSTNLFYYTLDASGFLHVYDFFLIAASALLTSRSYEDPRFKNILLLFIVLALAVLIRPTNIMLLVFVIFFGSNSGMKERMLFIKTHFKNITIALIISLTVFIPQLIYWNQSFNNPIVYSYGDEGFSYLLSPQLISVWFSPRNGLFIYAPILFISMAGMILSFLKKEKLTTPITMIFFLASYIFSSWWNYWFGCAMGARSFVDYYPLLMLPFAYAVSQIKNKSGMIALYAFCAACVWLNMNIIYYYDGCFYGGEWDWQAYFKLITD